MKIYLAGPDVFRGDAKEHGEKLKQRCKDFGHVGLFPLDNEIVPLDSKKIFEANLALIREADLVLANINPFRGPSVDPGTAWEMGAAKALNKPVYAYTNDFREYKERTLASENHPIVEDFGMLDNLMIVHGSFAIFNSFEEALSMVANFVILSYMGRSK